MTRTLLTVTVAAVLLAGCQTKPVSTWVPFPLPLEPIPSTKLTVVGKADTADEARAAAIQQIIHQVILPPSEPENAPTSEFVESMIRGYNVSGVAKDFLGKYYVTVEMSINQLGINYQELYHRSEIRKKEGDVLRSDVRNERQLRELAEQREALAKKTFDDSRRLYEKRTLDLQAQRKLDEQRIKELSQQRLDDEKQIHTLLKELDALKKPTTEPESTPPAPAP